MEVRSATAEEPADGNVWNADDTWTIEVYENGVKTGRHGEEIDDRSVVVGLFLRLLRFEGELRQQERPYLLLYGQESRCRARVVARDGYGNVFEQTEITTPLEADYPDAY